MKRYGPELKKFPTILTAPDRLSQGKEKPINFLKLQTDDLRWWINEKGIITCELKIKLHDYQKGRDPWRVILRYPAADYLLADSKLGVSPANVLAVPCEPAYSRLPPALVQKKQERRPLGICPHCEKIVWDLLPIPTNNKSESKAHTR